MVLPDTVPVCPSDAPLSAADGIDWRYGPALPAHYPTTVMAVIAHCVATMPDVPVMVDGPITATWRDLDEWSARVASAWSSRLSIGARCAILVPNGLPHLIAELACWRLGAIAAPIFLGFAHQRIHELVHHIAPDIVLVDDDELVAGLDTSVFRCSSHDLWAMTKKGQTSKSDRPVTAHTPCLLQFTSGSTGLPRGVVLTHGNLASQQAAFAVHWPDIGPGDRIAAYLPWHHSFGGLAERLWALCRGVTMTLVAGGGRDRALLVQTVRSVAPTIFMSVPKIHALMTQEGVFQDKSLRWAFTAGAPLPASIHHWYTERHIPICEGWGLTETSPSCTLTVPGSSIPGIVGWPIMGVAVGIRQADEHIVVAGPNVMAGYFRRESSCLRQGVLDTGDLGSWTDDGLRLRGRADHQLKIGNGEKVCAAALEAALQHCAGIRHVLVSAEPELVAIIELEDTATERTAQQAVASINARQDIPYFRIGEIIRLMTPMSIENHMLTASMKVSRGQVLMAYRLWQKTGGKIFERLS